MSHTLPDHTCDSGAGERRERREKREGEKREEEEKRERGKILYLVDVQ